MRKSLIFLMGIFFCIKISSQVIIKSHTKPVITSKGIFGNTEKISETIIQGLTEREIAWSSKEVKIKYSFKVSPLKLFNHKFVH